MKYIVSVFLIATVLLASTRAAPVPLSDDLLLDDDYLEDVVGSVVPEVDVDLSKFSHSDRDNGHNVDQGGVHNVDKEEDTHEHPYCAPWPSCQSGYSNSGSGNVANQQHVVTASCTVCFEFIGGECRPKACAPGKTCQLQTNKKKGTQAGLCG
jgi:hypothetical protein